MRAVYLYSAEMSLLVNPKADELLKPATVFLFTLKRHAEARNIFLQEAQ